MTYFTVKSHIDGHILAAALHTPKDSHTKGLVQIVHGMNDHKERYFGFMSFLADHGYACVIHDNRGHGASLTGNGELGNMGHKGYKSFIQDVLNVQDAAKAMLPVGIPVILMGHSFGSLAIRAFAKKYDDRLSALVIVGTPGANPMRKIGLTMCAAQALFKGWDFRSRLMEGFIFGPYTKPFRKRGESPTAWVCNNPHVQKAYFEDPLCHFRYTLGSYRTILKIMSDCYSGRGWNIKNPGMRVLFVSGEDDACMLGRKKFDYAVSFMEKRGYGNVTSRLYEGMRHEILNETDNRKVYADVLDFLDS